MKNIYFADKNKFKKIKMNFRKDGFSKIHFLADFDNTLTKAFVNWKKSASMVSVLRGEEKTLWEECAKEDIKLFNYYHPIEFDPNIELIEKKEKMVEWWTKSLELFIKHGLNLSSIEYIAKTEKIQLRNFSKNLLENLNSYNIPLVFISASWFWKKSIEFYLRHRKIYFDNIDIIWNDFEWDSSWNAIWYKTPIIHSFNKDETILEKFTEIHGKIKKRKNIILLWDSMWDPHISDWFDYDNILKIGFLNYREDELMKYYLERYDVVITWDWDMSFINNLLSDIL